MGSDRLYYETSSITASLPTTVIEGASSEAREKAVSLLLKGGLETSPMTWAASGRR